MELESGGLDSRVLIRDWICVKASGEMSQRQRAWSFVRPMQEVEVLGRVQMERVW